MTDREPQHEEPASELDRAAVAATPTRVHQFSELVQGVAVNVALVVFRKSCFIWIGGADKAMLSLFAAATNKYVSFRAHMAQQ
eukprot:SAG31_NODE_1553_length_7905_cov_3.137330_4_plen_83_part_00